MAKVRVGKHSVVVTPSLLLDGISSTVLGLYSAYDDRFGLQLMGRPGTLRGKYRQMIQRDTRLLSRFQEHVDDTKLLSGFRNLRKHLASFDESSERLGAVVASLRSERPAVFRKEQAQFLPEWIDQPPYREALLRASNNMLTIIDDVEVILHTISRRRQELSLQPTTPSEEGVVRKYSTLRQLIQRGANAGYIQALRDHLPHKA